MKGLVGRGFGLAGKGIPAVNAAKKPHRAFFISDTPAFNRFCCVKSHGENLVDPAPGGKQRVWECQ